jgi:hypothetical protein
VDTLTSRRTPVRLDRLPDPGLYRHIKPRHPASDGLVIVEREVIDS